MNFCLFFVCMQKILAVFSDITSYIARLLCKLLQSEYMSAPQTILRYYQLCTLMLELVIHIFIKYELVNIQPSFEIPLHNVRNLFCNYARMENKDK